MNNVSPSPLRIGFTARLIGATSLLLILTTMALNYYFYVKAATRLRTELVTHHQGMTRVLAHTSRVAVYTGNREQLTSAASIVTSEPICQRVIFFDETGVPLHQLDGKAYRSSLDTILSDMEIYHQAKPHLSTPAFNYTVGTSLIMIEPVRTESTYSAEDLFADEGSQSSPRPRLIGYVAVAIDTTKSQEEAQTIFFQGTAITIGVTLLSCLIVFAITHMLSSPLRSLTKEIVLLQGGNGRNAATEPTPDDFGQMVALIRNSYATIHDLKNTLEQKVAERTRQLAASNQELTDQKNGLTTANQRLAITLSQLQSTQAQLVQSEKMAALGMLISGLSHEIKNSINFVSSSVPLLEKALTSVPAEGSEACPSAAKARELLANIREGVERTVRVIDDLGHFCHDNGTFTPTDILPGLKSAVAIVRHEYGYRLDFIEEYAPALPLIRVRAGQLNQVFVNILLNAAQAIGERGTITVKSWADGSAVHVAITDTGEGIKAQIMNKIYDPFFTTKEVGQGTGMGLSISYTIIKSHGGDLKVQSKPGAGSTFEIVLPVNARLNGDVPTLSA